MPALLTRASRPPSSPTAVETSASATSGSGTSPLTAIARPPAATISFTTVSPTAWSYSATTTAAPWLAHSNASPRPMPRPAPVTMTTLSARSPMRPRVSDRSGTPEVRLITLRSAQGDLLARECVARAALGVGERRRVGEGLVEAGGELRDRLGPLLGVQLAVEVPHRHEQAVRPEGARVAAFGAEGELAAGVQPRHRRDQRVLRLRAHPAHVRLAAGVDPVRPPLADRLGGHHDLVGALEGGGDLGARVAVLGHEPPREVAVDGDVERGVGVEHVLEAAELGPRWHHRERRSGLGRLRPGQRAGEVDREVAGAGLHLHPEPDLAVGAHERGAGAGQHGRDRHRHVERLGQGQRSRRRRQELAQRHQVALGGQARERAGHDHVVARAVAGLPALARAARTGAAGVLPGLRLGCRLLGRFSRHGAQQATHRTATRTSRWVPALGVSRRVRRTASTAVVPAQTAASRSSTACSTTPSAWACTLVRSDHSATTTAAARLATHSTHHARSSPDGRGRCPAGLPRPACSISASTDPGTDRLSTGTSQPATIARADRAGTTPANSPAAREVRTLQTTRSTPART